MANRQTSKIVDLYFGIETPLRIENAIFLQLVLFSESGSTNLNKQNCLAVRLNCPKDSWIESDLDIVQRVCRHADWLRAPVSSGFRKPFSIATFFNIQISVLFIAIVWIFEDRRRRFRVLWRESGWKDGGDRESPLKQKQEPHEVTNDRKPFNGDLKYLSLFGLRANVEKSASPERTWRSSQKRDLFNAYQKVTLAPKRTNRDELATPVIWPKVVPVTPVAGLPGFGWLRMLKTSARISPPIRSVNLSFLKIELSRFQ